MTVASVDNAGQIKVTILGAGVIGLTAAMLLSKDKRFSVTIVAKHMPGDYDIEYASPWAGANYLPVGGKGSLLAKLERETWPELHRLARDVPEAAVHFQDTVLYRREKDSRPAGAVGEWMQYLVENDPWYKDVVPDGQQFRLLTRSELPAGHESGFAFTSVCINTAIYLPWLIGQCLKNGAIVKRGIVEHVNEAAYLHHSGESADIVINATGLFSGKLGGVQDADVYPARGQIVLVRNEASLMITTSGTDDGATEANYIMQRAAGGGCILGGCLQANNWESQPDPSLALRIMQRAVQIHPQLTNGKGVEALSVIRHGVGLRPMRKGGPRVEREYAVSGAGSNSENDVNEKLWIVHAYGHGGYGYQSSYGSAYMVLDLVERIVRGEKGDVVETRARI